MNEVKHLTTTSPLKSDSDWLIHCSGCDTAELYCHDLESSYDLGDTLGTGTFGTVKRARAKRDGSVVAIKTLKDTRGINPSHLREVQFFEYVPGHRNLVHLHEMFTDPTSELVHFSMELMDLSLLELIRSRSGNPFTPGTVAGLTSQILRGIAHIHTYGYVHRDLKPENILISYTQAVGTEGLKLNVKIADFGLSRRADNGEYTTKWTAYVATRWYRSPEQLLGIPEHTYAIDIWAFGLLLYEISNLTALFPGKDTVSMLRQQHKLLGNPGPLSPGGPWVYSKERSSMALHVFANKYPGMLPVQYCRWPEATLWSDILLQCLRWDPNSRPSAVNLLSALLKVPTGVSTNRVRVRSRSIG